MIKDKDIAREFLNKQFEVSELMNQNLAELKSKLSAEEFDITRKATVDSIGQRNSHVKTWGCGGFLNETNIYSKGKSICF